MIIKIMKQNRIDFWMCDNVETVHVDEVKKLDMESLTVNDNSTRAVVCSIFEIDNNPKIKKTWAIDFKVKNDDERYTALFNTIAYICNDNGQTVERIYG